MSISLDGVTITTPKQLKLGWQKIEKKTVLSSGKTMIDIVARKRIIEFNYSVLSSTALNAIIDILDADTFYTIIYPEVDGTATTKTVYLDGDITGTRPKEVGTDLLTDISFTLVEQ